MLQLWAARCVTRYWMAILIAWIAVAIFLRAIAPAWDSIAADGDLAFLPPDVTNSRGQQALEAAFPGEVSRSRLVIVMARQQGELSNGEVALSLDLARRLHWLSAKAAWEKIRQEHWERLGRVDAPDTEAAPESPDTIEPGAPSSDAPNAEVSGSDVSSPDDRGSNVSTNDLSTSVPGGSSRAAETLSGNEVETTDHDESDAIRRYQASTVLVETANDNLTQIIEIEDQLVDFLQRAQLDFEFRRLPDVYRMRGELLRRMGDLSQASIDLDLAELMREEATPTIDAPETEWASQVLDVWTWRDDIVGHKLTDGRGQARLILIQLATELTATRNIHILEDIETIIEELRAEYAPLLSDELRIEVSGSAAVGADMLRAAAGGVKQTEIVTVALVLLILAVVYRAPLLIAIPLLSISLSLVVALSVIALLARNPHDPNSWGIGVFTTSRIFIVVLLFGAGTDFCLFFLARSREMLRIHPAKNRRQVQRVIAGSWRSVHLALIASASTTIVGLAMMWFSDFEKFRYSGPTIAIALAITLAVCLTFTPALLSGLGRVAFWPLLRNADAVSSSGPNDQPQPNRYWDRLAGYVVERPVHALCVTLGILLIPAIAGVLALDQVTYDLTDELSANATSRRGQQLIAKHFPSDDSTPITLIVDREQPFETEEDLRRATQELTNRLYTDGVDTVRSLSDPLGDYPPGKRMSLFSKEAWRRRILRNHRITHQRYISPRPELAQRVAKFDVTLKDNPFSLAADRTLADLQGLLERLTQDPQSAGIVRPSRLRGPRSGSAI
jgi:putative drug exporter of the RND superfamily